VRTKAEVCIKYIIIEVIDNRTGTGPQYVEDRRVILIMFARNTFVM